MYSYHALSLDIKSELEIPGALTLEDPPDEADVTVVLGKCPDRLEGEKVDRRVRFESTEHELLYHLKGACKMLISHGKTITIEPEENADWQHIINTLRSRGLAAALQQRKYVVLHASSIVHDGRAVLFLGRSGAGKSTTMGALAAKGYPYLTDDLTVIRPVGGQPCAFPAYPDIRLWGNALELIGEDHFEKGPAVRDELDKYYMKPKAAYITDSVPISHIYWLSSEFSAELEITAIPSFEAIKAMAEYSFAKKHLVGMGGRNEQFTTFTHLLKSSKFLKIRRPHGMKKEAFNSMIAQIEKDFSR